MFNVFFYAENLEKRVRELYDLVCRLEEEKYDWEFKLRKMDFEVSVHTLNKLLQRNTIKLNRPNW